ncbi:hypothetical protein [Oscillibacter sp.]|uniref:hypothetical protein n=1 Tax=Oscillibacter sp. TaxID=1945593 RepID=UPI0028AF9A6D|nr:hypothetical protein [Oscillibacter sp.]
MGLIKLLWDLYYFPRHHKSTLTPDDWPPDGSLHFIKCGTASWKSIPETYRNYEFSPNEDEYDHRIGELGLEIMKRFCVSRRVLTKIRSVREVSKKKSPPDCFPVRYQRFLQQTQPQTPTYAGYDKELFFCTYGFDRTALAAFKELDRTDDCFFDYYVFPDTPAILNAEDAAKAVAAGNYDVWFDLSEWGPCALYVTLNPETVDVGKLQELIAAICTENNILFQNPKGYEG